MKKILKVLGILLLVVVIVIGCAATYVGVALPDIDAPADLKVELTPERVERGRYLANSVCVCMDCHSQRDWNVFAAPIKQGTFGGGGEKFDRTMQFPGEFYSKNLTPFALAGWTDGELYRAITSGVSKDGHPFFPVMPYPNYNKLATEDVHSIIAYLRSLAPLETQPYPASVIDFPVNLIMRTVPEPANPMALPKPGDAGYGAYVANAASCVECHTNQEKGKKIGEPFAGGFAFNFPNGAVLRSPNITPHPADGIGAWDKAAFIKRFRSCVDSSYVPQAIDWAKGDFQTVMPWQMYATMTDEDLGAIYDYIIAQPAVAGKVEKWTPPPGPGS
ncbi:MAG: c-type cytochrome [Flavobacteriales bacterium]|nr:c-type cytochrome [Flavobacteriales bacterium]